MAHKTGDVPKGFNALTPARMAKESHADGSVVKCPRGETSTRPTDPVADNERHVARLGRVLHGAILSFVVASAFCASGTPSSF